MGVSRKVVGVPIIQIHNMNCENKGNLLLTIPNGADKAEVHKRELTEKAPGGSEPIGTRKEILHLKDMDEITKV